MDITKSLMGKDIKEDIKNEEFFFYDNTFIFISPEGHKNYLCIFDDKITEQARKYADKYTPTVCYDSIEQKLYMSQIRTDYWTSLFHLFIWKYLENNKNKVTLMKMP